MKFKINNKIIYLYLFKEILKPISTSIFIFTAILLSIKSLELIEIILSKDSSLLSVISVFVLLLPKFLEIAIPMSVLLGIILGIGKLSTESEIIAIRSFGLSYGDIAKPVWLTAIIFALLSFTISVFIRPWSDYKLNIVLFNLAKTKLISTMTSGAFNDMGNLMIYAEKYDQSTGQMENVVISDNTNTENQKIFIAKSGIIQGSKEDNKLSIKLFEGTSHEGTTGNFVITEFNINSVNIDADEISDVNSRNFKKPREMNLLELSEAITIAKTQFNNSKDKKDKKEYYRTLVEINRRFSLPISCLAITLLSMSLGVVPARGSKGWGITANIIFGIGVLAIYYLIFALTVGLGDSGALYPPVAIWIPTILLASLSYYFFKDLDKYDDSSLVQSLLVRISKNKLINRLIKQEVK